MKQSELATALEATTAQLAKVKAEVIAKLTELETALANQENVTPEVQSAFDSLKSAVTEVDDLNADTPTEPTV